MCSERLKTKECKGFPVPENDVWISRSFNPANVSLAWLKLCKVTAKLVRHYWPISTGSEPRKGFVQMHPIWLLPTIRPVALAKQLQLCPHTQHA